MDGFAFLISWWSLTGRRPTIGDLQEILRRYSLLTVLYGLTRISLKLRSWENSPTPEADREMVRSLFPSSLIRQIEAQRANYPDSLLFHRVTILFLIKEALLNCPDEGSDINRPEDLFAFSECYLLANDLVLGYVPS